MGQQITVGAFAANLKKFAGEYEDSVIDAIGSFGDGYLVKVKSGNGTQAELKIAADMIPTAPSAEIDDEIREYSIRENVFYITQTARMLKELKNLPDAALLPVVIQLAERFELEYGDSPDNTTEQLKPFAVRELLAHFGI